MPGNTYVFPDDNRLEDPPGAPRGDIDLNKRYTGAKDQIPMVGDSKPVENPIEPNMYDTDQQIRRDESEAMDRSNVMKGETPKAKPRHVFPDEIELDYKG